MKTYYEVRFVQIHDKGDELQESFETKEEAIERARYLSKIGCYTDINIVRIKNIKW